MSPEPDRCGGRGCGPRPRRCYQSPRAPTGSACPAGQPAAHLLAVAGLRRSRWRKPIVPVLPLGYDGLRTQRLYHDISEVNDHLQLTVTGLIAACPQSAPCAWCWSPSPGYRPIRTTRAPSMMLPPTVFNRFAVTREINDTAGASICPEPTRVDFDRISGAGSSDSRCIDRSRRRRSLTPGAVEAAFGSASTRLSAYPLLATSPTSSSSQTTQSHLT